MQGSHIAILIMVKLKNKLKKKSKQNLNALLKLKKRQDKNDLKQANKSLETLKEYGENIIIRHIGQ